MKQGGGSVTFADVVVQPPINSDWAGSAPVGTMVNIRYTMASFVEAASLSSAEDPELNTPFNQSLICMATEEEFFPQLPG